MSEENKDLGDKAEDAMDKAKDKAKDLGEKASEKFDDAKEATKEFADEAKDTAKEFSESAKEAFSGAGGENKKLLAGILAIVLGWLGVHKFILGYTKEGVIMAVIGVVGWFLCGIPTAVVSLVGLVEGILYLTKSDEEFYNTYQVGKKPWF